jgi:thioesterase domain-containing protein
VNEHDALCRELERVWHTEIPISAAMQIHVVGFSGNRLEVRAALAPNVNVHGTAFAGSLYAIAALCGWGATWATLRTRALDGHIVIADGRIGYHRPVSETIVATCVFDPAAQQEGFARLHSTGKGRFPLVTHIGTGEPPSATFEGSYAVRLNRANGSD